MNEQAHQYVEDFMAHLTLRNPNEPEFHQAVREVAESLAPDVYKRQRRRRADGRGERPLEIRRGGLVPERLGGLERRRVDGAGDGN